MPSVPLFARRVPKCISLISRSASRTASQQARQDAFNKWVQWKVARGELTHEDPPKRAGEKRDNDGDADVYQPPTVAEKRREPSLYEQLFPNQGGRTDDGLNKKREEPLGMPLVRPHMSISIKDKRRVRPDRPPSSSELLHRAVQAQDRELGPQVSVLVLCNASKNLVEDDFRRLAPKGQHIEGWNLEDSKVLQVIPARDWQTLEQQDAYYVLFASATSAFLYQRHAIRIHKLVNMQTPSNVLSPMLPPPGYLVKGIDANEAIASFTLVPPNQPLDLRMLREPLSPLMRTIVKHRGYPHLLQRDGRMPFEARLTLEGPQMHLSSLRHVMMLSGKDRSLSWSGNEEHPLPNITEWKPPSNARTAPAATSTDQTAKVWAKSIENRVSKGGVALHNDEIEDGGTDVDGPKRRTPPKVFILGFYTENAMHSFVHFWHRRPLEWQGFEPLALDGDEEDLAPITHVEPLW